MRHVKIFWAVNLSIRQGSHRYRTRTDGRVCQNIAAHVVTCLAIATGLVLTTRAVAISINEIRIDQTGADNDEYFELAGSPGESLNGLTYLVIGDSGNNGGIIEVVVNLNSQSIPSDGFFLAAENSFTLGGSVDLVVNLNFENEDNVTHLLATGFTGANQDDLDTDDDGALDVMPWSSVVDSIAVMDSIGGDPVYSAATIGPNGSSARAHVFRDPDGAGSFQIGGIDPAGGGDTLGAANVATVPSPMAGWMGLSLLTGLGAVAVICSKWRRK